ncbi:MAG TPA: hypothetical protein VGF21_10945 [Thermoleophilaceae bacterium]|jgi:hypothetical protein
MKRASKAALGVLIAIALLAAAAFAAQPVKGGHYSGHDVVKGDTSGQFSFPITFTVSRSGKRVKTIKFAVHYDCIAPGGIPFHTFHKLRISHGKFRKKHVEGKIKNSTGNTDTVVVSGRFRKHRKAVGKISEKLVIAQGKGMKSLVCSGKTSWKAKAK